MDRSLRTAAIVVLALLLLSAATLMAGCTQQQPLTVKLTDHPTYGKTLTDSTGRSLYIQARDVPNTGAVANLGDVGRFYPPFYAESVVNGDGINVSEFGHITRADGKQQTTFRGWPLYYYINDKAPGDAKSQGANNITFLAKPDYTVMVRENVTFGVYLSDTIGLPILAGENGTGTGPMPGYIPFRASPVLGPSPLVQAADFGEATWPSGEVQTTYRGQPLYSRSDRTPPSAAPQDTDGYHTVILAPGGALTGALEAPTPAPSPSPTGTDAGTAATTVPATTAETAAATRTGDAYTGGAYTPTPFQTVQVINQATESATPSSTWTSLATGNATPLPTVSALPPTSRPPTQATATVATNRTTAARTTTVATTKTPATPRTTTPPTSIPTTKASTVPVPITPPPTVPPTSPTTLPLPFPITTLPPNPAISVQGGNGS